MTELSHISITGFKSISTLEKLELRPINILVGANGSGKSNFISAFAFLHEVRAGRLAETVALNGGAEKFLHFGSKATSKISFELSFAGGVNGYSLQLVPSTADLLVPSLEEVAFWDKNYTRPYYESLLPRESEAGISASNLKRIPSWIQLRMDRWRLYHFHDTSHSSPMKKTASIDDNRFFRPDASNMAPFLYLLQNKHPQSYQLIRNAIRQVAPFFQDFQLGPLMLNPQTIKLEWRHAKSSRYFDASMLSDGTLRFICLAILFLQPRELRPHIIVIDEPELGLHPFAVSMLAAMIKSVAHETQVIISTQSTLLLDNFEPEDVLVADLVNDSTRILRLDASDFDDWLEGYSLGQLWEKNHFGGRPSYV